MEPKLAPARSASLFLIKVDKETREEEVECEKERPTGRNKLGAREKLEEICRREREKKKEMKGGGGGRRKRTSDCKGAVDARKTRWG